MLRLCVAAAACALPLRTQALESDLLRAAETVAGVYSSIGVHELGHALVYRALGAQDIRIDVPRPGTVLGGLTTARFSAPLSPGERQAVAVSGLLAANLAGELVLQRRGLHNSAYAQSLLGTAVASNLVHVAQYYGRVRGRNGWAGNDIDEYELSGGNPHALSAALVAYSLWTLQRMKKQDVPLFFVNLRF